MRMMRKSRKKRYKRVAVRVMRKMGDESEMRVRDIGNWWQQAFPTPGGRHPDLNKITQRGISLNS